MSTTPFEFYLTEVRAAWLECKIIHDGSHYDLSVQCTFSNPLKDLFTCLCDLHGLQELPDQEQSYCHHEFEWGGEGWLYLWEVIPLEAGKLQIRVAFKGKREVGGSEHLVWQLDLTTDWESFAKQVFTQASELLWMYGFAGYYSRWSKDFPAGQMMRLGHLLHGKSLETTDFSRELGYFAETS